ncbi:MAG: hypothetical protein EXS36_14055 [Pedosphaera sp.]|nr:hypothetical protein [Pedosphaera sp.]
MDILSDIDGLSIDRKCYGNGNPGQTNQLKGSLFVSRQLNYTQFPPGTPKPAKLISPSKPFEFSASALPEPNANLTSATVTPQGKPTVTLTDAGFGGIYTVSQGFDTLADLDAAYPSGSYKFNVVGSSGSKSGSASMPASGGNIPEVTNLTEAQTLRPKVETL